MSSLPLERIETTLDQVPDNRHCMLVKDKRMVIRLHGGSNIVVVREDYNKKIVQLLPTTPVIYCYYSYDGRDNQGKPKSAFRDKLQQMTDDEFLKEAQQSIWLSAYAQNNPRSDYHWHATACYDEAQRRGKPELYTKAYEAAKKSAGY